MDVASLGFSVDSSELKAANQELKKIPAIASAAERAAEAWGMGTANAGRKAAEGIKGAGEAAKKSTDQMGILAKIIDNIKQAFIRFGAAALAALSIHQIVRMADTWSDLSARVGLAAGGMDQAVSVMDRLSTMSRRTYSSLEATAEGFTRNATAMRELGYGTTETLDYLEAINNALVVSGAKGDRAQSVMNSLSKAMAVGHLSGQELNTVLSSGGRIATALAAELGVSTVELRKLGAEGKITGPVIYNALTKALNDLRVEADSMPATIGDSFVLIGNALLRFIGALDKATGASETVAKGFIAIADGIDWLRLMILAGITEWENYREAAMLVSAILTAGFAPAILTAIATGLGAITASVKALTVAIALNPIGLFAVALSAAVVLIYTFRSEIKDIFGVDLVAIVGGAANTILQTFSVIFVELKFLFNSLPNVIGAGVVGAVNAVKAALAVVITEIAEKIDWLIDKINLINPLSPIPKIGPVSFSGPRANPHDAELAKQLAQRKIDVDAAMAQRPFGQDRGPGETGGSPTYTPTPPKLTKPPPLGGDAGKGGDDPYAKIVSGAKEFIATQKLELEILNKVGFAAREYRHQQEMLLKAANDNIALSPTQRTELEALGTAMANAENNTLALKLVKTTQAEAEEFVANQKMETEALYMSSEAAESLRMHTALVNAAKRDGITLTPEYVAALKESTDAMAAAKTGAEKAKEEFEFYKGTFRSFVMDFKNDIAAGKSIWDAFGQAGMNALQKISDKLMEMAADQLFEAAFGGGDSGGGGLVGGILKAVIGGIAGGAAGGGMDVGSAGNLVGGGTGGGYGNYANGAAFRAGNVIPFAKGGMVNSPTMFPMSGGRSGLMGEAGPEAIMPLTRGNDGRLGVQVSGRANEQPQQIIVTVTGDTDLVRVTARTEAGRAIAVSGPQIENRAVKKSAEQTPAVMNRHENQTGGDWRFAR